MRVLIVTPAPRGDRGGNRITALRWAALIRSLGHRVRIAESYDGGECDLLIALHAKKSHGSVLRFRARAPQSKLVVALTGTDLYTELEPERRESLELADRIIALQPRAIDRLRPELRAKARAIFQSATPIARAVSEANEDGRAGIAPAIVAVVGHLRRIKDPFRAAEAVRLLPEESQLRVVQAGGALEPEAEVRARKEMHDNPRYQWLGNVSRREVRTLLSKSRALVLSSLAEGGANVVSEAIAAGLPILASRIEGTVGQLGEDYPAYFEPKDTRGLADLMLRLETDRELSRAIAEHLARIAPLFAPDRERALLSKLLGELEGRPRLSVLDLGSPRSSFREDVTAGLRDTEQKRLSCRYLYDETGSRLFQAICGLEEYYVPRAEREILEARREEIVALAPVDAAVVELGSGDGAKTRVILDAIHRRYGRVRYLPVDIAKPILEESARALLDDLGGLEVNAIAGEYGPALTHLHSKAAELDKLILFLGSNIGNFDRLDAVRFLATIREAMSLEDRLLIGIDLRKDRSILVPAYDDPTGVTAEFNLNLLARINRELRGDFDLNAFAHRAEYEEVEGRMAMYLESLRAQTVRIDALDLEVGFAKGERIHTEYSYKYSPEEIDELATQAGLRVVRRWLDSRSLFSSNVLAAG